MIKNKWLTATKWLIWVMVFPGFLGMGFLAYKTGSFKTFLTLGSFILLALFVLSLFLCFKQKKIFLSFILGFVLVNLCLRIISLFSSYSFLAQRGAPLMYLMPMLFWFFYECILLFTAYKAYKTFPAQ